MASTVKAERSRLHDAYAPLRVAILDHYHAVAELTGGAVEAKAHKLPKKLGQWHSTHSGMVLSICPELADVVSAIEDLCAARDPDHIRGNHKRQRPGPKPGWQRTGPLNSAVLYHTGGEYRDGTLG
jgi:hypothetical protein